MDILKKRDFTLYHIDVQIGLAFAKLGMYSPSCIVNSNLVDKVCHSPVQCDILSTTYKVLLFLSKIADFKYSQTDEAMGIFAKG